VIAALVIATPVAGQGRARGRDQAAQQQTNNNRSEGRARGHEESRPPAPAARPSLPPQASSSPSPRQRAERPDRGDAPQAPSGRNVSVARPRDQVTVSPRQRDEVRQAPPQPQVRQSSQGRAVPRPPARPVVVDRRPVVVNRTVVVAPRHVIIAPRPAFSYFHRGHFAPIRVVRYYQPYYVFQPRARFSFGLSIGYPVAYPVWYDPYPYYGYSIGPRYGGISFDIDPTDAAVFIDGEYVGRVDDFSPYDAPLTLPAGYHSVELRARGWQPMRFDITILAGEVIPYRGALGYVR
jgi:hypothetical protein